MKGIFILGPSGSGKTTITKQLHQLYTQIFGQKSAIMVNLDAANETTQSYDIDINQLITIEDIMQQYELGPNGALMYAMEFLQQNIQWLLTKLKAYKDMNRYVIFDLPGQIQVYINHASMKNIVNKVVSQINLSVCVIQIFDSTFLLEINHFISLCMMSLSTLINLQFPHINILNKIDILKGKRPGGGLLNDYLALTSAGELIQQLIQIDKNPMLQSLGKILDSFGKVAFLPYSIYKTQLLGHLIYELQRVFGSLDQSLLNQKFAKVVQQAQQQFSKQKLITSLQNQLFEEQQQDIEEIMKQIREGK